MRGELETGTDCYILTQSSSEHSSTSFAFWLGCSTVGHWGPQALSLQADSHAGILSNWHQLQLELTQAVCGTWLYNCLTPTCFCLSTQVYFLIDSSVKGQYVTCFSNHKMPFTFQHDTIWKYQPVLLCFSVLLCFQYYSVFSITLFFYIARSTSPDEDFQFNQNLSIIIISHTKIILIKYFCIQNWS